METLFCDFLTSFLPDCPIFMDQNDYEKEYY